MKWLFGSAISFFKQGNGRLDPAAQDSWKQPLRDGDVAPDGGIAEDSRAAPGQLNRRHAGIFYADIANYTRLTEEDEEGTHLQLVEAIKIMMANIAANDGRIAHLAGDAILAEFKDSDSALHCAINVQLAARQWNADRPRERQVNFRIGVNFGEVISDQGDIYGNAVNLAARLEKLASSGGICVSENVREELEGQAACQFIDLGENFVKNMSEPVRAFRIDVKPSQKTDPGYTTAVKVSALSS